MKTAMTIIVITAFISGFASASSNTDKKLFSTIDENSDGVLTRKEVLSKSKAIRFTNLYYPDSFNTADINNDGLLDIEEYLANEEDIY